MQTLVTTINALLPFNCLRRYGRVPTLEPNPNNLADLKVLGHLFEVPVDFGVSATFRRLRYAVAKSIKDGVLQIDHLVLSKDTGRAAVVLNGPRIPYVRILEALSFLYEDIDIVALRLEANGNGMQLITQRGLYPQQRSDLVKLASDLRILGLGLRSSPEDMHRAAGVVGMRSFDPRDEESRSRLNLRIQRYSKQPISLEEPAGVQTPTGSVFAIDGSIQDILGELANRRIVDFTDVKVEGNRLLIEHQPVDNSSSSESEESEDGSDEELLSKLEVQGQRAVLHRQPEPPSEESTDSESDVEQHAAVLSLPDIPVDRPQTSRGPREEVADWTDHKVRDDLQELGGVIKLVLPFYNRDVTSGGKLLLPPSAIRESDKQEVINRCGLPSQSQRRLAEHIVSLFGCPVPLPSGPACLKIITNTDHSTYTTIQPDQSLSEILRAFRGVSGQIGFINLNENMLVVSML